MRGIGRKLRGARSLKGACARCLHWRQLHATPFGSETISALCERCFEHLEPSERLRFYQDAWVEARSFIDEDTGARLGPIVDRGTRWSGFRTNEFMREWNAIHAAVMAGE